MKRALKKPLKRSHKPFEYKRACDRCAGTVFLRSELQLEPQTGKLVCQFCLDKPSYKDNQANFKMIQRRFKFD
jgi:transcription elongation factor Elf1